MAKNWGAINRRRRRKGAASARAEAAEKARPTPSYPRLGGVRLGGNAQLSNVDIVGFGDAVTATDGTVKIDKSRLANNRRGIVADGDVQVDVTDSVIE
jgi:hypothetical protein